MSQGMTQAQAQAAVLAQLNEYLGNYTNLNAAINAYATLAVNDMFSAQQYTYIFTNDNASLIMQETLPASRGTDEVAGKTFTYGSWNNETGLEMSKDPSRTLTFTSSGGVKTYSGNIYYNNAVTNVGSYSYYYDWGKRAILRPAVIDGKTPAQHFAALPYNPSSTPYSYYESEAHYRMMQTAEDFDLQDYYCNPALQLIGGIYGQ